VYCRPDCRADIPAALDDRKNEQVFNLPVRRFWIFELLYPPIVLPSLKKALIEIGTYIEIQPTPIP
jgi:hypothetical protein